MKSVRLFSLLGLLSAIATSVHASSIFPLTPSEQVEASGAVFRGTVVNLSCFRDSQGLIYTATSLRVDEPLKGKFPAIVKLVHRGGTIANEEQYCDISPRFELNGEYLVFVKRGPDGRLICTQGGASAVRLQRTTSVSTLDAGTTSFAGASGQLLDEVRGLTDNGTASGDDVTDQAGQSGVVTQAALVGMLGGHATRFIAPDRGEPIPYLIDADSLPAGISLTQATNAVWEAFNAWVEVTSLKFRFAGIQSFGQGADTITTEDEVIRIQLHDNYNRINSASTLGIGGRGSSSLDPPPGTTWNIGGNIAGNDFWKTTRGYVILESGASAMQTLSTFTEVLCHEIGHSLNMAHSSETQTNDTLLSEAMMFYQAHADGRGATLGAYDPPVIQQMYPSNTAPYSFSRFLDVDTGPSTPNVPGVNEATVLGFDLQSSNLTIETASPTSGAGTFSQVGDKIKFTPAGFYADSSRLNPASGDYYDEIYVRFSDGTNASPFVVVRVVSLNTDSEPYSSPDGIPDRWMNFYFGHSDPQAGDKSRASDDADGDGWSNLREWLLGSDPTDANSGHRIVSIGNGTLQFQAKPYELYELEGSTDFSNWTSLMPIQPTNAPFSVLTNMVEANITATVSNVPMSDSHMFYRIVKVP